MKKILYFEKHMKIATKFYELSISISQLSFKSIAKELITRKFQSKFENWNCFDITSKKIMKWKTFCDFFSFKQFMMFHFFNIKFSSSFFKRFNCLSRRCSFALASRTSFRMRNRFLCTLRMIKEKMTKSQILFDATHARHFSNASLNKHCLFAKEQNLQRRMLRDNTSKLKIKNYFRWEEVRLLLLIKGIFHIFGTKVLGRDPVLRVGKWWINIRGTGSHRNTRIARIAWQASKRITWLICSKCSRIEQGEHEVCSKCSKIERVEHDEFVVYIDFEHDFLKRSRVQFHTRYLVIAFIVEAYVISYWFLARLSLTDLSTKSKLKSSCYLGKAAT